MSVQTVTIKVAPQVAAILEKLKARAEAQGVTLQRLEERQATRPFTEAGDIVETLREARSGAMWGYEPTE